MTDQIPSAVATSSQDGDLSSEYNVVFTSWKQRSFIEFYLQLKSVYHYRRVHNVISYPIILLSAIAGTSVFSTNNTVIQYIAASFSVISALLTGVLRQSKPGELATEHLAATRRWSRVLQQIQQLEMFHNLRREDKNSHQKLQNDLNKLQTEIESIISSQPEAAVHALHSIRERFGRDLFEKIVFGEDIKDLLKEAKEAEEAWRQKHLKHNTKPNANPEANINITVKE